MNIKKNLLVLASTSDFSLNLSQKFYADGWNLYGVSRTQYENKLFKKNFLCNFDNKDSVEKVSKLIIEHDIRFDLIINFVGTIEPIGLFSECDFDHWLSTCGINAFNPLRLIKNILNNQKELKSNIIFFSGAGTNDAAPNYSAYCLSKIILIKMTEILDEEYVNSTFTILGPGVVDTKIHNPTLRNKAKAANNLKKLQDYYDGKKSFTDYSEIYNFLNCILHSEKKAVGGRNFSVVYDNFNSNLIKELLLDSDLYKLRRYGNDKKF